jgi:hypothetical protein
MAGIRIEIANLPCKECDTEDEQDPPVLLSRLVYSDGSEHSRSNMAIRRTKATASPLRDSSA